MLKAYKYRIYPTKEQQKSLLCMFGSVRFIYNKCLEYRTQIYKEEQRTANWVECSARIIKMKKEKEFEWLKEAPSQSLQMANRNLDNAFMRFFRKNKNYPKFKNKSSKQSFQLPQCVKVDFKNNSIILPKLKQVKCMFDRKFEGKIKTTTVSKNPSGKYFVSILVDDGKEEPKPLPVLKPSTIGIDLGLNSFITTSNGLKIAPFKTSKNLEKRLKCLQARLAKKVKGSKNRIKARIKVAKKYERIFNQKNNFQHKLSSKLINDNQVNTFCLEKLNVEGMLKNRRLSKSIQNASWSNFVNMISYKAKWKGKNVIQIGTFEPSSKTCHKCSYVKRDMTLKDREWDCPQCGTHHDRDINATINIAEFGIIKHYLPPAEGGVEPVKKSRKIGRKINPRIDSLKQENYTDKSV